LNLTIKKSPESHNSKLFYFKYSVDIAKAFACLFPMKSLHKRVPTSQISKNFKHFTL